MHTSVFKEKLKKLNPLLYVKEDAASSINAEHKAAGIYYRASRRTDIKSNYARLSGEGREWLEADESGNKDRFVTGCPTSWIPEYDIMDIESGRILAKGWRTLVLHLVKERFCTQERARKIFSSSLGEHTWDRASYEGKLAMIRKEAGWKSAQQRILDTWK